MPLINSSDSKGRYYRYDGKKKYYYKPGDKTSRLAAKKKAIKQAVAISYSEERRGKSTSVKKMLRGGNVKASPNLKLSQESYLDLDPAVRRRIYEARGEGIHDFLEELPKGGMKGGDIHSDKEEAVSAFFDETIRRTQHLIQSYFGRSAPENVLDFQRLFNRNASNLALSIINS